MDSGYFNLTKLFNYLFIIIIYVLFIYVFMVYTIGEHMLTFCFTFSWVIIYA